MASKPETIAFILGKIATAGTTRSIRMFGEYGIYCDEKMVALVCDDQLFIKPSTAGRAYFPEVEGAAPYPGARDWFLIPEDYWEDEIWLTELVRITSREVPYPKKKKKK
ncbi:MAG: TfoX/Sxy family protein [Candidatus Cloacimonetes bacterium]|nr:TfoX/Sxy family protein [Candidatus Cloacimonadota bacterium]